MNLQEALAKLESETLSDQRKLLQTVKSAILNSHDSQVLLSYLDPDDGTPVTLGTDAAEWESFLTSNPYQLTLTAQIAFPGLKELSHHPYSSTPQATTTTFATRTSATTARAAAMPPPQPHNNINAPLCVICHNQIPHGELRHWCITCDSVHMCHSCFDSGDCHDPSHVIVRSNAPFPAVQLFDATSQSFNSLVMSQAPQPTNNLNSSSTNMAKQAEELFKQMQEMHQRMQQQIEQLQQIQALQQTQQQMQQSMQETQQQLHQAQKQMTQQHQQTHKILEEQLNQILPETEDAVGRFTYDPVPANSANPASSSNTNTNTTTNNDSNNDNNDSNNDNNNNDSNNNSVDKTVPPVPIKSEPEDSQMDQTHNTAALTISEVARMTRSDPISDEPYGMLSSINNNFYSPQQQLKTEPLVAVKTEPTTGMNPGTDKDDFEDVAGETSGQ